MEVVKAATQYSPISLRCDVVSLTGGKTVTCSPVYRSTPRYLRQPTYRFDNFKALGGLGFRGLGKLNLLRKFRLMSNIRPRCHSEPYPVRSLAASRLFLSLGLARSETFIWCLLSIAKECMSVAQACMGHASCCYSPVMPLLGFASISCGVVVTQAFRKLSKTEEP